MLWNNSFLCFHSVGLSQRTNVISCVTVHDSDSSTASPLTPLPRTLNPASALSSRQAKSLAVVAPSVKTQGSERGAVSRGRLETGESRSSAVVSNEMLFWVWKQYNLIILTTFWFTVNYIKPKRSSNRQPCSSGDSVERHGLVPSQSHPLNLSQVRLLLLFSSFARLDVAVNYLCIMPLGSVECFDMLTKNCLYLPDTGCRQKDAGS